MKELLLESDIAIRSTRNCYLLEDAVGNGGVGMLERASRPPWITRPVC